MGAVEFLRVKHITKKTRAEYLRWKRQEEIERSPDHSSKIVIKPEDEEKIIAATVILRGEKKRKRRNTDYISFITPEAYFAIQEWLDLTNNIYYYIEDLYIYVKRFYEEWFCGLVHVVIT